MKPRIYYILFAGLIWFFPVISNAQFDDLRAQLEGKESFGEITATVEEYLSTAPDSYEKEKFEKRFARWAYYQSLHLGPDGEFVNVAQRTFDAVQDKAPPSGRSANGSWYFIGPNSTTTNNPGADILGNGRADRIAFHPSSSSTFYVGTPSGGLWKTTNGGSTWTAISSFIPSLGISGVVVDHTNPNTLYVLTGDGDTYGDNYLVVLAGYHRLSVGVLVSYDAGVTWQQTGELFNGEYVGYRLVQHPTNANILLAATSDGIYRTTNGGDTWTRERTGKHFDIEFKPGDPTRVYASGDGSFVYSTNTGDTWNTNATFNHALCANERVELAVTPDYASKVYLLAGPKGVGNTFCGFYVSYNSGSSFTRLCNSPNVLGKEDGTGDQSYYDMGLAVSPTNDQIVIAAGLCTYRSTNGGSTFTNATVYREGDGSNEYIHPDIHAVEYNPLNNYLYALGDGGIHRSTDHGQNYTDIYTGLNTAQFYGLDDYDANQYALLAGCQDNGVKYKTANTSAFSHIYCCDGADVIINYNNQTNGYAVVNQGIKRYTNFTTTSPTTMFSPGFFPEIEMHSSNPDIVYVGYSRIRRYNAGVYEATLGGIDINGWWALKTCPSNSSRIYAAGGDSYYDDTGEMFVSSNAGATWSTISGNTGFPASYNRISDIGVESDYSGHVWVTFSGYTDNVKVYYSNDIGSNWYNRSYDLPNIPVWTIEADASNNVYVGTEYGVYYLEYGATSWEPFYNGLPNVPVSELALNETSGVLHAATFGRGIWKTTDRSACPVALLISTDIKGQYFRSASSSIRTSSEVVGGEGTSVVLRAGTYVDMETGFHINAKTGNKYLAYTGDCDTGMPPELGSEGPYIPETLKGYDLTLTREKGTLEVSAPGVTPKELTVRVFKEGDVRVVMADAHGNYIKDVANFRGDQDTYNYTIETAGLKTSLHYLYLVINDEVVHLQELDLTAQ